MNPVKNKSLLYRQLLRGYRLRNLRDRHNACYNYIRHASYEDIDFLIRALEDADCTSYLPDLLIGNINISAVFNICKVVFAFNHIRKKEYLLSMLREERKARCCNY